MPRTRPTNFSLSELLRRSVPAKARERLFSVDLVRERWRDVVGESLAGKAEPYRLHQGVLTVRVADVRWGKMIVQMAPEIVPKLNAILGFRLVRRINFARYSGEPVLIGEPRRAAPGLDREAVPTPKPPQSIQRAAAELPDSELGEILSRVAARSLDRLESRTKEKGS